MIRRLNESREDGLRKGQRLSIQSPYDDGSTLTVTYLKPGESPMYFYCVDGQGNIKHFKRSTIIEVLPSDTVRKMSRSMAEKLFAELDDLKEQLKELMWEQDEVASQAMEEHPELDVDAPNEDPVFQGLWADIDKISERIQKIENRLRKNEYLA